MKKISNILLLFVLVVTMITPTFAATKHKHSPIPMAGTAVLKKISEATCSSKTGYRMYCNRCHQYYGKIEYKGYFNPNKHPEIKERKLSAATCTKPARYEKYCNLCKKVLYRYSKGKELGHNYKKTRLKKNGKQYIIKTCTRCHYEISSVNR